MGLVARTNDIVFGVHQIGSNTIIQNAPIIGSTSVFAESKGHARITDIAVGACGVSILVQGSPTVLSNSLPTSRLGDQAICIIDGKPDIVITSSGTVFVA